ncbi:MAG: ATP-binding protein [Candidatus Zixiibacteriota bacterium]
MTPAELRKLVEEIQQRQSELDDVEVKTAKGGTPKRIYESLSAFANRPGGGVVVFGLAERRDFEIVGVGDFQRLQEEVTGVAADQMAPALRPQFTVDEIEGETVAAMEIEEVPAAQKPCFYKNVGLPKGAYIRVGNTNRPMTEYEIFGYQSGREQPRNDEEPALEATLDDLNQEALNDYVNQIRKVRPRGEFLRGTNEDILLRLHVARRDGSILRPTLAGLLMFGKYPQEFFPQLMITYVQYFGTTESEKTPQGARFVDNRALEGSIPEMVEQAETYVLGAMRKSTLIEGLFRRDIPEYPQEVVREAVCNAVAHRDYSSYVGGSYIQIRMFADRLEIQSPGGLFGNVTVENIEEEHSTRNARLMRMMEDMHLVENRGSGIKAMLHAMRDANLEPPRFDDRRSSFKVVFMNHTLINPEAIEWLNQFSGLPLDDGQRLALVYLRHHSQMSNSDYRRMNRIDALTAGQELRGLVQAGLVDQKGVSRGTYYTLKVPAEESGKGIPLKEEGVILSHIREKGPIGNSEVRQLLGVDETRAYYILKKLCEKGSLNPVGKGRWRRYALP